MELGFFFCMLWASTVITAMTINTSINFFYGTNQVFHVFAPDTGDVGPLGDRADEYAQTNFEESVVRRLYAIEVWLSNGVAALGAAATPFMWYYTYASWISL